MKRLKLLLLAFVFLVVGLIITNYWISYSTSDALYEDVDNIPKNKVGLLLGTAKYLSNGTINLYYKYRIDAIVALYEAGKIEFVLVSGDNSTKYYDEPTTFKEDLMAKGIPANKIFLDYAGFRTLDSVVRSKAIFGQDSITIVSQKFHNERAIYLANNHDIKAVGFNADNVSTRAGLKVQIREYLARAKASIDVLFNVEPKFYGEKIIIE
ncbi:MAG: ElyC/SanA/YdcF family protein [Bacteroidota bacterium]